jgi:hypothetical protein
LLAIVDLARIQHAALHNLAGLQTPTLLHYKRLRKWAKVGLTGLAWK